MNKCFIVGLLFAFLLPSSVVHSQIVVIKTNSSNIRINGKKVTVGTRFKPNDNIIWPRNCDYAYIKYARNHKEHTVYAKEMNEYRSTTIDDYTKKKQYKDRQRLISSKKLSTHGSAIVFDSILTDTIMIPIGYRYAEQATYFIVWTEEDGIHKEHVNMENDTILIDRNTFGRYYGRKQIDIYEVDRKNEWIYMKYKDIPIQVFPIDADKLDY